MTREEAIAYFKKNAIRIKGIMAEEDEALKDRFSQSLEVTEMAIKALEQEPIISKDKFIYALTACGCLLKDGKTWYEHNELIKCFEDLGLFEQEPTIKALGEELRKARKGIADEKVLIGYNMAIAICNKHLGESEG